ncbi:MAG: hypothetical protein ACRC62_00740, partial [Microcoleus sp.]
MSYSYFVAIGAVIFSLLLVVIYGCLTQEVTRRRRAEKSLRQQTDRERLVAQIAQQIRQSL